MKTFFKNPLALFYAIVVHAILAAVLVVSFDWEPDEQPKVHVVKAVAVDESKVEDQIKKLKEQEARKKRQEEARKRKLEKEAKAAEQRRKQEEKRLSELQQKKKQELKEAEQKRKTEEKRLADLKKKQELEQRKQQLAEKKRKQEEEKLAKAREEKRRLQEKLKKEEEVRQRKLAEERRERERRELEEALLQEQMQREEAERSKRLEEEQRLAAAQRDKEVQSVVDKYTFYIQEKVQNAWRKPATSKAGLKCTVYARLIPGGDVMHVEVVKSSGDAVFDRSVETAVHKAVPLPLPADPALFEKFREITFLFDPEQKT